MAEAEKKEIGDVAKVVSMAKDPRKRGFPKHKDATGDMVSYQESLRRERADHIANDTIVKGAMSNADPLAMMRSVLREMAREAAALDYQRTILERDGKDITQLSTKRVAILRGIAQMESDIHAMGRSVIDVRGDDFHKIFLFWLKAVRGAAEQVLTPEQVDLFFNQLESNMEDWEDKVESLIQQ